MSSHAPEPGEVPDPTLGIEGDAEPLPDDDKLQDEPTYINEPDDPADIEDDDEMGESNG